MWLNANCQDLLETEYEYKYAWESMFSTNSDNIRLNTFPLNQYLTLECFR